MSSRTIPQRVVYSCDRCGLTFEDVGGGYPLSAGWVRLSRDDSTRVGAHWDLCRECGLGFNRFMSLGAQEATGV